MLTQSTRVNIFSTRAFRTFIRLDPSVNPLVNLHLVRFREAFSAVGTLDRSPGGVLTPIVPPEAAGARKPLTTLFADVRINIGMSPLVLLEAGEIDEALPAVAFVRTFSYMRLFVLLQ